MNVLALRRAALATSADLWPRAEAWDKKVIGSVGAEFRLAGPMQSGRQGLIPIN